MIQTKTLDCPSCGAELLDPIYDLEMVDGGRRRLTCGECGRLPVRPDVRGRGGRRHGPAVHSRDR